jgi:hypothetical protein
MHAGKNASRVGNINGADSNEFQVQRPITLTIAETVLNQTNTPRNGYPHLAAKAD